MHKPVLDRLVCAACRGDVNWQVAAAEAGDVLSATAACASCGATYEVRDGVAILAPFDAQDIWRDSTRGLADALAAEPATRQALMGVPLFDLNGADLVFRAMVHEARGELAAAAQAIATADPLLYGAEQRACRDALLAACVRHCAASDWVLDVASGRGTLVELLARAGIPVVASDLSAVAMLRLRARMADAGLTDMVDCLVADAAALPFADASIPAATTYVGLQNIPDPRPALAELRRACNGAFRNVGYGYPPDDAANRAALTDLGFTATADLDSLSSAAASAGWATAVLEECRSRAQPTPRGEVIADGAVDALPVSATTLEWYLLEAS
jgi:SAM-dependent methyltransferase/uncharacterized protein YbaR (Trm112 family)